MMREGDIEGGHMALKRIAVLILLLASGGSVRLMNADEKRKERSSSPACLKD